MRRLRDVRAEENARFEPFGVGNASMLRRDPVEPEPVGTIIAMAFRITGYDPDCDGSLMARLECIDRTGRPTGWEANCIGLYPDTDVVLERPGELHELVKETESR